MYIVGLLLCFMGGSCLGSAIASGNVTLGVMGVVVFLIGMFDISKPSTK